MTDRNPAWQKPNKALKEQIADLRAAIAFTISPDFPAPNDDAARLAWLRAWWRGETMRMEVARPVDPAREHGINRLIRAQVVGEEPPPAKEDSQ